jgi:hypothetical protein
MGGAKRVQDIAHPGIQRLRRRARRQKETVEPWFKK